MNDQIDEAISESKNKLLAQATWGVMSLLGSGLMVFFGWLGMETLENRQFRLSSDRYSQQDAARDKALVEARFAALPTPDVRKALSDLQADMRSNSADITRLKTIVERIDTRTR